MQIFTHVTYGWGSVCGRFEGTRYLHIQQLKDARAGMIFVVWRWTGKSWDSTDRSL